MGTTQTPFPFFLSWHFISLTLLLLFLALPLYLKTMMKLFQSFLMKWLWPLVPLSQSQPSIMLYTLGKHAWISLFIVVSKGQSISFLVDNVENVQGRKSCVVFHFFKGVWERKKIKVWWKTIKNKRNLFLEQTQMEEDTIQSYAPK